MLRLSAQRIATLLLLMLTLSAAWRTDEGYARSGASTKQTILGVAFSPAHVPKQTSQDIFTFFDQAAEIGSHVTWIVEWESMPPLNAIETIQRLTREKGLKFHLQLSPIALYGGRKTPAIPASVGGKSFSDIAVREAFKKEALRLASLSPDYLCIGTEVNLLAQNPPEFEAYVTLARETYQAIKQDHPSQIVTISFQWDVIVKAKQSEVLDRFANSLDIYSFTTYPNFSFPNPDDIPQDYYLAVRKALPTQRLGFSEVGFISSAPSSEEKQARFYGRVLSLIAGTRPEYITLAMLHDVALFTGDLSALNSVGIRTLDDKPKKSWDVVVKMPELH
jgi:hypothetical protein